MHKHFLFAAALAAAAIGAACGDSTTTVNVNRSATSANASNASAPVNAANAPVMTNANSNASAGGETDFIKEAAMGGMAEVELGKLASTKAANAEVKKFAQMMVQDHTAANNELKALATKKSVSIPADLDTAKKADLEDLRSKVGAAFDDAYVDAMVEDHEKDVAAFEDKAKNASDADVKAFAAKTLPTLKKHLDAIKAIRSKMP